MFVYGDECFFQHNEISISKYSYTSKSFVHSHCFFEIAYVSSGEGVHIINGREYPISRGDYMIIDPTAIHCYDGNVEITNLIFLPTFLDKSFRDIESVDGLYSAFVQNSGYSITEIEPIYHIFKDDGTVLEKILHIKQELETKDFAYANCVKAELEQIIMFSLRQICNENEKQSGNMPVQYIEKYIFEHYDEDISLSDLCNEFGYSLPYISKRFKATTGINFTDYLQKIRIQFACRFFVDSPHLTTEDIAQKVGYSDIKYFTSVFKKYVGTTPSGFKRKLNRLK